MEPEGSLLYSQQSPILYISFSADFQLGLSWLSGICILHT
jgi:hypothetical protein